MHGTIDDDDGVLHRFDPKEVGHYSLDEATNVQRIRSGAFRWDEYPTHIASSSYSEQALAQAGLGQDATLEGHDGWRLARSTARSIRDVEQSGTKPFDAIHDPWPDGIDGSRAADEAHALITHARDLGSSMLSKARRKLARDAFTEVPE